MINRFQPIAFISVSWKILLALIILTVLIGCTATRFLKEDETFYDGAKIKVESRKTTREQNKIRRELETYITPKPNGKLLGSRPGVWFYYVAGTPRKKKGFRSFVKNKLGKEPVLLEDATPEKTSNQLERDLHNEGYFKSDVISEIKTRGKKSKVIYNVSLARAYRLKEINYHLFDTTNNPDIKELRTKSLLKEDQRYRLEGMQAEQKRVEEVAQNLGFYYFDDRYLLFEADTTVGERKVDLDLFFERNTPDKAKRKYIVREINVYPNYTLGKDSLSMKGDSIHIDGYNYIDNMHAFRPEVITNVINLRKDSVYRRIDHEYTISRLMSLNAFKFVNVKFVDDEEDSSSLRASIYITPLQKKSLRLQVQGVSKSNNFVGPGFEATFTNRNFLRGAELFQLRANWSYESQISRQQSSALNSIEFGAEASLAVPRFITPIPIRYRSAKYLPQTQFKLGYNFQKRLQYFKITSFNAGYGYVWRETTLKTHELFPIDVSFVRSTKTSTDFDQLLEQNPTLASSFQDQFIPGLRYSFTLNTQLREDVVFQVQPRDQQKSHFYLNTTLGLSGNVLKLLQSATTEGEPSYELFGLPYSRYVRGDLDFRYYLQLDKNQKLATRLALGAGYALGDSTHLPYIKQFAVGGSTSIRAFPARSVGPGTYNVRADTSVNTTAFFIDQRGDIKLEGSVEYRFDLIKSLKGALFFDAGNIWLMNEDASRPGGKFDKDNFISEVAVGTGFGLRYDFNFFVMRFDAAFPIRKPFLSPGSRWVLDAVDFGSKSWRRENLILNIAIGYPF